MSASRQRPEWRRWRCATPLKLHIAYMGAFCAVRTNWSSSGGKQGKIYIGKKRRYNGVQRRRMKYTKHITHCKNLGNRRPCAHFLPYIRTLTRNTNGRNHWYFYIWQGKKASNPRPTVLETAALPAELFPYLIERIGGPSGTRTPDRPVMSRLLYQLS